jgi:hypothetical protein
MNSNETDGGAPSHPALKDDPRGLARDADAGSDGFSARGLT